MTGDELLDSALAGYSAGEPLLGMEQRVMARIRGARDRGAAAAMCVAVAVHAPVKPIAQKPLARVAERAVAREPVAVRSPAHFVRRSHRAPVRAVVRKARPFPSLPPLTDGERGFLMFVQSAPELVLQSTLQPIVIQEIEIKPLQTKDTYEHN